MISLQTFCVTAVTGRLRFAAYAIEIAEKITGGRRKNRRGTMLLSKTCAAAQD
jgi:hypothetical protein